MDHVDMVLAQWRSERPDLDVSPMGLVGRINRLAMLVTQGMQETWSEYGLSLASFDVLATLRRAGSPYALSPGDLIASTMVSSGTMTNRIDQLEKAGLVERAPNPDDRRSTLIALTPKGFDLIDRTVTAHVATQARLVGGLSEDQFRELDALLRVYLQSFETKSAPSRS